MAHIVSTFEYCKLRKIIVVYIVWVLKSRVFIYSFMLSSLKGHFFHLLFLPNQPGVVLFNFWVRIWESH